MTFNSNQGIYFAVIKANMVLKLIKVAVAGETAISKSLFLDF
jgi:hypothetical protein